MFMAFNDYDSLDMFTISSVILVDQGYQPHLCAMEQEKRVLSNTK